MATDEEEKKEYIEKPVYAYITTQAANYKTARVHLTRSKSWSMYEHIERCTNVANAWYNRGSNEDGQRPYDDIVTPVINVAFRSEGFDVKDIVPYVNDVYESYKSFLVKKFHPQWARKNQLDTFIDDVVETSIIYDLVLVKNVQNAHPEVIDLKTISFCDMTDVMAGPICLEHQLTPAEISEYKGKWSDEGIAQAIALAVDSIDVSTANNSTPTKTPGKYIKAFELRGNLPESWNPDIENGDPNKYTPQMHIVCYYKDKNNRTTGITLYAGTDEPLEKNFKSLKIDRVRSKGRACGRSVVESLFEPQVWNNYAAIKVKALLDAALTIFQTDSVEYKDQKLTELKNNTVLGHETGKPITKVDGTLENMPFFTAYQKKMEDAARILGSASDAQLGTDPSSGTPFALQSLVVQQGQGFHEYRQGKIATFFADVLYPDLILPYLVAEMDNGKKFSEELSLDEMIEITDIISTNKAERQCAELMFQGKIVTQENKDQLVQFYKDGFRKGGNRKFFEVVKGEMASIPVAVFVNIKGKQKDLAKMADSITNIIRAVLANPQAFSQMPGISKAFNEVLEASGLSPIDFTGITKAQPPPQNNQPQPAPPVGAPALATAQ